MQEQFTELAASLRAALDEIPQGMRQEAVSRQVIIILLAGALRQMGLVPVPAWRPPRSTRDRLDLVGVVPDSDPPRVEVAVVVDPLVELAKVRAMEWVDCPHKVVVTYSDRPDKVKQSTFFLTPGLTHINLYGKV